jgi:IclR-like helix-turn-helix domain-containing protein
MPMAKTHGKGRPHEPARLPAPKLPLANGDISVRKRQRQSVIRAFEILGAFHYPGEWVRACDLSRRTLIPEATVSGLMTTLETVGAVIRDGQGQYQCALLSVAGFNQAISAGMDSGLAARPQETPVPPAERPSLPLSSPQENRPANFGA